MIFVSYRKDGRDNQFLDNRFTIGHGPFPQLDLILHRRRLLLLMILLCHLILSLDRSDLLLQCRRVLQQGRCHLIQRHGHGVSDIRHSHIDQFDQSRYNLTDQFDTESSIVVIVLIVITTTRVVVTGQ